MLIKKHVIFFTDFINFKDNKDGALGRMEFIAHQPHDRDCRVQEKIPSRPVS